MRRWLGAGLFLIALGASAQGADWTRVAPTLHALNAQILDWAAEYATLAAAETTPEAMAAVITLHFQRGAVVAAGLRDRLADWKAASETQKKSRFLAVSRYFATHVDDWGSEVAWNWYRCLTPPLDARYNALAAESGSPVVPETAALSVAALGDQKRRLVELTLPVINAFLNAYAYPIVDTPITRFDFEGSHILLDGRLPRDRQLLNKAFSYAGTQVGLFGPGF
jgi:hypothetical protein